MKEEEFFLLVKATPKAKRNAIVGWENGMLKIQVKAPPEKGEANKAIIALLSQTFGIPQKDIRLIRGTTARIKQFCLVGLTKNEIEEIILSQN